MRRIFAVFVGFDLVVAGPIMLSWLSSFAVHDWAGTAALCAGLLVARIALWSAHLRLRIAAIGSPPEPGRHGDAALLAFDAELQRLPLRHAWVYTASWILVFVGGAAIGYVVVGAPFEVGRGELLVTSMQVGAMIAGAMVLSFPLTQTLVDPVQGESARRLYARKLARSRSPSSLQRRLIWMAVGLALAPMLWLASLASVAELHRDREDAGRAAQQQLEAALAARAAGAPELGADAQVVDREVLPPALREVEAPTVFVDRRHEQVYAAAALGDGEWLLLQRAVVFNPRFLLHALVPLALAVIIWGVASILAMTRSFMIPLARLREATRRAVEIGDLGAMGTIPPLRRDEVGELTNDFNLLLGEIERTAAAARAVAAGDLRVTLHSRGELSDAFRGMLTQLNDVVAALRRTALEVASAASEIHAATREQEVATVALARGVREVSETMDSLAGSALEISGASEGVRDNAEGTLTTTDEMVGKIGELGEHTKGIVELLEVIRDVADRSDLLALNGSLEATRAGEAGRGFALVAAEMRRLAERVTGTVADVRELVADIKSSTATTVMATEQSRRLAQGTAAAARRISDETRRQSAETEQASLNVREVAHIITQTSVATTQTRAAAEDLLQQAETLEQLINKFELSEGSEGSERTDPKTGEGSGAQTT